MLLSVRMLLVLWGGLRVWALRPPPTLLPGVTTFLLGSSMQAHTSTPTMVVPLQHVVHMGPAVCACAQRASMSCLGLCTLAHVQLQDAQRSALLPIAQHMLVLWGGL